MSIDLVVVNYHTPDDLDAFQASLNTHCPAEPATLTVVDVDTEPSETCFEWAGGTGHRIGFRHNIGYGLACNLAAARGDGELLALFNADIELTAGAIDVCAATLRSREDCAIVGPRQIDRAYRIRHAGIFGSHAAPAHRGWNEIDCGQHADTVEAVTVSGSAFFAKRAIWDELTDCPFYRAVDPAARGAFLATPHYYEETWASYHAWAHGYKVLYEGSVTIVHKWHRASPVGGWAEHQLPASREMFRRACDAHGIPHD